MEQAEIKQLSADFISRLSLSGTKPAKPFLLATIGIIGSGRTTVAKKLVQELEGSVLVQANSARFLLKEKDLPWGQNVRDILKAVSKELLDKGYAVVFDGNAADKEDRENIQEITGDNVPAFYIRINIDPEIAKQREIAKYNNPNWISSFDDFKVNTAEKMIQNIEDRVKLHQELKSSDISGLVGEIDNDGGLADLDKQVKEIAEKIKSAL